LNQFLKRFASITTTSESVEQRCSYCSTAIANAGYAPRDQIANDTHLRAQHASAKHTPIAPGLLKAPPSAPALDHEIRIAMPFQGLRVVDNHPFTGESTYMRKVSRGWAQKMANFVF